MSGRHGPSTAFISTRTRTGIDDVINLLLGKANAPKHCAVQVGMSLAMKTHVGVKEGIVLAGFAPAGGTVRLWNQMSIDAVPAGVTSEILLVDSIL